MWLLINEALISVIDAGSPCLRRIHSFKSHSEHDAHRPLLPGERLDDIFMLRNQRRLSKNLTLNYGGVLHVLDDTPEANATRGTRVDVYEAEDGTVSIRAGRTELPARAFQKSGLPREQGAVVANKLLADVLDEHRRLERSRTPDFEVNA